MRSRLCMYGNQDNEIFFLTFAMLLSASTAVESTSVKVDLEGKCLSKFNDWSQTEEKKGKKRRSAKDEK